jgi:hypothetical protein
MANNEIAREGGQQVTVTVRPAASVVPGVAIASVLPHNPFGNNAR